MAFVIGKKNDNLKIFLAENEWPGVKRIAGKVAEDIRMVTDTEPEVVTVPDGDVTSYWDSLINVGENVDISKLPSGSVYAGTCGHSNLADRLMKDGKPCADAVRGKREVYLFEVTESGALVIIGSDKRGTIYGLFKISELLGVSPWVWFADVTPAKREEVMLTCDTCHISKEPSVEYRGIFINDEWPSFGYWTFEHFGGFTAKMYEHVFELILRLKGNYLWPAMWTSNFSLDGPGFLNAELADEMGIVMSNSHHEPCLRHSEEWDLVKGDDTPYGSAWNFDKNKEGLTNYWRDGLKRNGHLENIITMGMRGERDSEVLGREATLKENIDYIKEVVKTQNELIKETVNEDLTKVPRMIAIYKEVEKYYNGDDNTEGLRTWDGLDGITCMLCEDNFGNMRGLPHPDEAGRKGGFGMYYHFDYHGGPISYEWINSTTLNKTWEQMSEAYEAGVRKIWIVNTGDLKPQELPISFFMDLAYDYEKWGASNKESATEYLKKWTAEQFGGQHADKIVEILDAYTYINLCRKPEALNPFTYDPFNYGESDRMIALCAKLYKDAEELSREFKDTPLYDAYEQLVGFPARATANLNYMQLCSSKNMAYAKAGRPLANVYAQEVRHALERDEALRDMYHSLSGGKWNSIMLSEHIGFTRWNDEEAMLPTPVSVIGSGKPRMTVSLKNREKWTCGGDWTRKPLCITDFLDPETDSVYIMLENTGGTELEWQAVSDVPWIKLSAEKGKLPVSENHDGYFPTGTDKASIPDMLKSDPVSDEKSVCFIEVTIDRAGMSSDINSVLTGNITASGAMSRVFISVPVIKYPDELLKTCREAGGRRRFVPVISEEMTVKMPRAEELKENELGAVIEASEFDGFTGADEAAGIYVITSPLGKYRSSIKAYPVTKHFDEGKISGAPGEDPAPTVSYNFLAYDETDVEITLITAPSNPIDGTDHLCVGVSCVPGKNAQSGDFEVISTVKSGYRGGEGDCFEWAAGVLDQEHRTVFVKHAAKGDNTLTIRALDPGVVIERILIRQKDTAWSKGYLGKKIMNVPGLTD